MLVATNENHLNFTIFKAYILITYCVLGKEYSESSEWWYKGNILGQMWTRALFLLQFIKSASALWKTSMWFRCTECDRILLYQFFRESLWTFLWLDIVVLGSFKVETAPKINLKTTERSFFLFISGNYL